MPREDECNYYRDSDVSSAPPAHSVRPIPFRQGKRRRSTLPITTSTTYLRASWNCDSCTRTPGHRALRQCQVRFGSFNLPSRCFSFCAQSLSQRLAEQRSFEGLGPICARRSGKHARIRVKRLRSLSFLCLYVTLCCVFE
jgi:hypothetical protein